MLVDGEPNSPGESFMQSSKSVFDRKGLSLIASGLLLMLSLAGCGGSSTSSSSTTQPAGPRVYFAPSVVGGTVMSTFLFDDGASTFSQMQPGPQILNAGQFDVAQRGLRDLQISTTYVNDRPTGTGQTGGFALELSGQAGGLVQLPGQPAAPLAAPTNCPTFATAQTYQFVTIPAALLAPGSAPALGGWDATAETAYGSVDISTTGSTVNFQNIHQFTLPSGGGTGAPEQPSAPAVSGACAQTSFGYTIAAPVQAVISNPGAAGAGSSVVSPQATIGIGPSGLLVEDNGSFSGGSLAKSSPPLPYENLLGAGTGAVGMPQSSTALDTSALVGAQYLGFISAAGVYNNGSAKTGWSSHLASFGFSALPLSCASVNTNSPTVIFGGDFPKDNPSASGGIGNSDFALDLGTQDSVHNGLFPHASIWVGAQYPANTAGGCYSFSAVAIAGQLNGKYAIFVIGVDASQPWAIYLLQSN